MKVIEVDGGYEGCVVSEGWSVNGGRTLAVDVVTAAMNERVGHSDLC